MASIARKTCIDCLLGPRLPPVHSSRSRTASGISINCRATANPSFYVRQVTSSSNHGCPSTLSAITSEEEKQQENRSFLSLYRELLEEAQRFPSSRISRKLRGSFREAFRLYMHTSSRSELLLDPRELQRDGEAALTLSQHLQQLSVAQFDLIFQYSGADEYYKSSKGEDGYDDHLGGSPSTSSKNVREVDVRSVCCQISGGTGHQMLSEGDRGIRTGGEVLTPRGFEEWLRSLDVSHSDSIALAISGGVDSMALALVAHDWSSAKRKEGTCEGRPIAFVVDHKLREESGREASTVGRWLTALGIENEVLECHWPGGKKPPAGQLQQMARTQRYALLEKACRERGIRHLLTAHHADDQAELFLLRLSRCSGIAGLAGMSPMSFLPTSTDEKDRIRLLRPFLEVSKQDLYKVCEGKGHPWAEDPTNGSLAYARNRIRSVLEDPNSEVPMDALRRVIGACRRMRALMDASRDALLRDAVISITNEGAEIDIGVLVEHLKIPYQEPVVLRALSTVVQAVSQRELPPRSRGLRALLARLRTPPFEGELHVGGHIVVAAVKGSRGTKASVARYSGWPPPRLPKSPPVAPPPSSRSAAAL